MMSDTQYWFNTATHEVEEGHRSSWTNLMGPYTTRAEAEQALSKAAARNQAWDEQDERDRR
jgi:hypothetical protein